MSGTFPIDTSPTKPLLVSNLTRDASTEACLFDLIDNAIDAARDSSYANSKSEDRKNELPTSYKGFEIDLDLDGDKILVRDNCGGMLVTDLSEGNLRFGQPSSHDYGIGLYGVGLNRAIFKLGNNSTIETESEDGRFKVAIDRKAYLEDDNWQIQGIQEESTGNSGTLIRITNLDAPISRQVSDDAWLQELKAEVEIRYARFLEKGLQITINGDVAQPNLVRVREDGPYPPFHKSFKLDADTTVYIIAGQHSEHRFSAEPDYVPSGNRDLSNEYGWSIVCNDRVIVHLDTSQKTGWVKKWHNEFNGFVGYVFFTSKDPKNLPWNTQKTDIDPNHSGYQHVLKDMQAFVERWRNQANEAKRTKKAGNLLKPPSRNALKARSSIDRARADAKSKPPKRPLLRANQSHDPFILPADVDEAHCRDKLLQLVHEAKSLNVYESRYACLAMIRMLFEASSRTFLIRNNIYSDCVAKVVARREKATKKKLSDKEKKAIEPTLDELVWLFENDNGLWLSGAGNQLGISLRSFSKRKERMNSAIHSTFQMINVTEAIEIRDECLPMLRWFLER